MSHNLSSHPSVPYTVRPMTSEANPYDAAIIGGGMAGMATAARLQAQGLRTIVLEAHSKIGGCAGYFRRRGFSFDVGATTLVDFEPGGVGGELMDSIGMPPLDGEALPGYVAWLPDRTVTLHRDPAAWARERLTALGDTPAHRRFWALADRLADAFWGASRRGVVLPLRSLSDVIHDVQQVGLRHVPLARYLAATVGGTLRRFGLGEDKPLCGLLAMLIEDTVHSTLDRAPLINAALGITIRGAGLMRHRGGMYGFWEAFGAHYRAMGGDIRLRHRVTGIDGRMGDYRIRAAVDGAAGTVEVRAAQVVCAVPVALTAQIAPAIVRERLAGYIRRDADSQGGAVIVFLGVPEREVEGQAFTHHQLLQDYDAPLGNGNNMFVSVSAPGDTLSAPPGMRAVMISTHCALADWEGLAEADYAARKRALGDCLIAYARRVYPSLGEAAQVYEIATPRTYQTFTGRERGAVGGVRQTLWNSNQFAVPHDLGVPGFWLAGDTTFPGLGTVACVLGSRIAADGIAQGHGR
ncbi:MAG: NAD(P)/FAD-dependent oxidoreductase [bacterium]|nr:NAD(P)/FAD-dependent oxidoreductase [bacterium]